MNSKLVNNTRLNSLVLTDDATLYIQREGTTAQILLRGAEMIDPRTDEMLQRMIAWKEKFAEKYNRAPTVVGVTGGRSQFITKPWQEWLASYLTQFDMLIHGDAAGVDKGCGVIASRIPHHFTVLPIPALWKDMGKAAGHCRNELMAGLIDHLIAFPGGVGTYDMIRRCVNRSLPITFVTHELISAYRKEN